MITRTTLKTLWLAGGGVLATWLAVTPNHGGLTTSPPAATQQSSLPNETSREELNSQAERLRSRSHVVTLSESTRNPFRFNAPRTSLRTGQRANSPAAPAMQASVPVAPPPPSLTLSGVAEKKTSEGTHRTAVISGDGQLYLVGVGDLVAGRYTVVSVDPEAVVLRDASGNELRLAMRQ